MRAPRKYLILAVTIAAATIGTVVTTTFSEEATPATTTTTQRDSTTTSSTTSSTTTSTTTTTTTLPPTTTTLFVLPGKWRCPQWHDLAIKVGWKVENLPTLDRVMWKESRCNPTARSTTSDSGLTQINDVHLDWLWDQYGISQQDLYDPAVNLTVALMLFDYVGEHQGCGWQPWRLTC